MTNVVMIVCEGKHEKRVILDLATRKQINLSKVGITGECNLKTEVVHPGVIDTWFVTNRDNYDSIIFLLDKDVKHEVERARSVEMQAQRVGVDFTILLQDPFLETFLASCFLDFKIDENLSVKDLKKTSEEFLITKFNFSPREVKDYHLIKKITLKKIKEKGGNIENSLRYEKRFEILKILK